jgi:hypothetical protein
MEHFFNRDTASRARFPVSQCEFKKVIKYSKSVHCFKITISFIYIEYCYCTLLLYKFDY